MSITMASLVMTIAVARLVAVRMACGMTITMARVAVTVTSMAVTMTRVAVTVTSMTITMTAYVSITISRSSMPVAMTCRMMTIAISWFSMSIAMMSRGMPVALMR